MRRASVPSSPATRWPPSASPRAAAPATQRDSKRSAARNPPTSRGAGTSGLLSRSNHNGQPRFESWPGLLPSQPRVRRAPPPHRAPPSTAA
eukprot:6645584-Prymnesium_polylepis.2